MYQVPFSYIKQNQEKEEKLDAYLELTAWNTLGNYCKEILCNNYP